ncbi:hypothetical protein RKD19_005549 [Streptomyces canus]
MRTMFAAVFDLSGDLPSTVATGAGHGCRTP